MKFEKKNWIEIEIEIKWTGRALSARGPEWNSKKKTELKLKLKLNEIRIFFIL
jgi:hypothetical protein